MDDKHKSIRDLTLLAKEINQLVDLGKAQVDLCESEPAIHRHLSEIYARIKSNSSEVSRIFLLIGNVLKGVEQEAAQVVKQIFSIVCDTVELLKIADKYTIKRLEDMTRELSAMAAAVSIARDMNMLAELGSPFARLAVDVAKLVSQRADTIDDEKIRASLENASSLLAKHTPALIMAVRSYIGDNMQSTDVQNDKTAIQVATQEIIKALSVTPEFAVLFDVNYIDTELAAKLAALAASVSEADPINVAKHSRAVNAEVAKQLKLSSADKTPATAEKCLHAQNASVRVLESAKEALSVRTSTSAVSPPYLAAEKRLNTASTTLQAAVAALPVARQNTTHLIKAAQDLSSKLQSLLSN